MKPHNDWSIYSKKLKIRKGNKLVSLSLFLILICSASYFPLAHAQQSISSDHKSNSSRDGNSLERTNHRGGDITNLKVAFCIDDSGSMTWNDVNDIRIQAAQNFVKNVLYEPGDEVAIYRFSTSLVSPYPALIVNMEATHGSGANYESYPFNHTISLYLNDTPGAGNSHGGVWYFQSQGNTPFYLCMQTALNQMSAWSKQDQYPVLIALTDGMSNNALTFRNFLPMARAGAGTGGVPIYTIGLGGSVYVEQLFMTAEISNGGSYYYAATANSLNDTFARIGSDIDNNMSRSLPNADKASMDSDVVPDYGTGSRDTDSRVVQNLQILNPAGGESWGQDVVRNITWACRATTQANCGQATVFLDNGNGTGWHQIASPVGTALFFPDVDGDAIPEKWNFYSSVTTYWYPSNPVGALINWDDGGVNSQSRPLCAAAASCVFVYNYNWTTPEIVSNNTKIRISVTDAGSTTSSDSGNFQIFKMNISKGVVLTLSPAKDTLYTQEDALYQVHYLTKGGTNLDWTFDTNASWLKWNSTSHNISGTPDNGDVGKYWVKINVSLGMISDEHNFTLTVNNTPPNITKKGVLSAVQDKAFSADINSSDDGQGTITWHLKTDTGAWLSINSTTGVLSGTPRNDDVGVHYANVSVDDGNGGCNWSNFTLTVLNVNDPPHIVGKDVTVVYEDIEYASNYSVVDPDKTDKVFTWSIKTNASWLYIDTATGKVTGLPFNSNVGHYWVNITVKDPALAQDFRNFTLTVINVNDIPVWAEVPADVTIKDTDTYTFDVNATDVDAMDVLKYSIASIPASTISIDSATGVIVWKPSVAGIYSIKVGVTDNTVTIYDEFQITVIHIKINTPPVSNLAAPDNGTTIDITNPTLRWTVSDKDADNVTTDLYLGKDLSFVQSLDASTKAASGLTTISFVPATMLDKGATYYWTVIPQDGIAYGKCTSGIWSFSITANASVNHLPKFVSVPALEAGVGVEWTYTPTAVDEDVKDTVTIRVVTSPDGMDLLSGTLRWTPPAPQVGKHSVKIEATDGKGSVFQEFMIDVTMKAPSNHAPTIGSVDPISVTAGQTISVHVNATDQDQDALDYSIVGVIPPGLEMSDLGQLTWKTKTGDEGVYDVIIMVSDGKLSQTRSIRLTVEKAPEKKILKHDNSALWPMLILIAIVAVVSSIIVIFLLMRRKSKQSQDLDDAGQVQQVPSAGTMGEPPMPEVAPAPPTVEPRPKKKKHIEEQQPSSKDAPEAPDAPTEEPAKAPIGEIKTTSIDIDDLED